MSQPQTPENNNQADQRSHGRRARSAMSEIARQQASEKIAANVFRASWFARAQLIACYLSTNSEVDTSSIILRAWRMKKRIFAPVTRKNGRMHFQEVTPDTSLIRNRYGLFEPADGEIMESRRLHIVLAPLVAFDGQHNRIGMGGGYYDRSFAFLKNRTSLLQPKLIGLAFDCQRVEEIVANPWDIRLYGIITEST